MSATPWMKWYPSDVRADADLIRCSLTARGFWRECLDLMHEAEPYGHLVRNGKPLTVADLASLLRVNHKTVTACLRELSDRNVYSLTDEGVIYSRRMVRDYAKALVDKENGRKGGNPRVKPLEREGVNPPVKAEVKAQKPEARVQNSTLPSGSVSRPRKRLASDETLPASLTPPMLAHATEHGFVNGNVERLFAAWRDHHISKATLIADPEASFRTWVRNEVNFTARRTGHGASAQGRSKATEADIFGDLADEFRKRGA